MIQVYCVRIVKLNVETEQSYVAVFHNIFFAFTANKTFFFCSNHCATGHQVVECDDFSTDKATFKVRVDFTCSLWCFCTSCDCPCSYFFRACCQIADKAKKSVAFLNKCIKTGDFKTQFFQKFFLFFSGQAVYIFFNFCTDWQTAAILSSLL